ncbi:response regulator [Sphingomonas sp. H39-1-10]|uniref:response regulator transcription factor n=1 Tax=Sphingomonas TaxID=13687 RepID=UPI00088BB230|nr:MULTISPECIES: response regulator [Sphingomonas]MDF0488343.1 response regulator [Sphingomonas pollutisoli]SDA36369.1 two component transcriptional regulator, LuxR family [Sphingomonas sp. NFR15]
MLHGDGERPLVHVIDDDDSVRRSLDFLLTVAGFRVKRWHDGDAFLKGAERSEPACVVLDLRMPGKDGLAVQSSMAEQGMSFPVIMLTGHGDVSVAVRAMQSGAANFLEKPVDREKLLEALNTAFELLRSEESRREQARWAALQIRRLTSREAEVLEGLACGYPNKTIAYDLGISARTVEVYRANVMTKLNVSNLADALRIAFAAGLGSQQVWAKSRPAANDCGHP